jgi:ribosome-associated protein
MLVVPPHLRIPHDELQFTFVRSSGPGGQNVNKLNTKAVLRWAVRASPSLPDDVRHRFLDRYRPRITKDGELVLSSQRFRDQPQNQRDCLEKLREMLAAVAVPPKRRRKTKPTRASVVRRQTEKRAHSTRKQQRRKTGFEE